MKKKISLLLLFFSLSFYAQNDTISVVKPENVIIESSDTMDNTYRRLEKPISIFGFNDTISVSKKSNISFVSADKMNVVYRGLENPISIIVPNCKSFSASGVGLFKDNEGKYVLLPGSGLESIIVIDIVMEDGSLKKEIVTFRIKNLPKILGAINGLTCNQSIILMTKKELKNAIISLNVSKDFLFEVKIELEQFVVKIGGKSIVINGTKFNKEVVDILDKLPINSIFEIQDLKSNIHCENCTQQKIQPIKVMIVKDNYFENEK